MDFTRQPEPPDFPGTDWFYPEKPFNDFFDEFLHKAAGGWPDACLLFLDLTDSGANKRIGGHASLVEIFPHFTQGVLTNRLIEEFKHYPFVTFRALLVSLERSLQILQISAT